MCNSGLPETRRTPFPFCPKYCNEQAANKTLNYQATIISQPTSNLSLACNSISKGSKNQSEICTSNKEGCITPKPVTAAATNINRRRSIALETAVLTVFNSDSLQLPIHDRGLRVLFDTGAQKSMVTKEAIERLGIIPVSQEPAILQGFGMNKPVNKMYDVAEIKLGRVNKKSVTFNALIINKLYPIPIAGACAFAKKVAKYNIDLADCRLVNQKSDLFPIDCLIANDYRNIFMSKYIAP